MDLALLLDPVTSYPSTFFSEDETCLNLLQQLGLRTTASLDTLLAAARFVEKLAAGEGRPLEGQASGDGVRLNMDEAVRRGQVGSLALDYLFTILVWQS